MTPRKGKGQGKRNNLKITSKLNSRKRSFKTMKKAKPNEKPLDGIKWLNKVSVDATVNQNEAIPKWLDSCVYKHKRTSASSSENSCEIFDDIGGEVEDGKSSITDVSEECHCNHDKYPENPKPGILKHKNSSTNRIMAKYIKSGMDQVASFIVESAIRFGKEHGVVVPDKNAPNVYEIMPPKKPYIEKNRKIKFNLPEKMLGYEDAKKVMWRSEAKNNAICSSRRSQNQPEPRRMYKSKSSSLSSKSDSLEDILPLLEDLKNCRKIVSSELDIGKLTKSNKTAEHNRKRERTRKKYRALEKRYKSVGNVSKASEEGDYKNSNKPLWKKCKRDSLELGRQRLRPATCPRQPKNLSPSPY